MLIKQMHHLNGNALCAMSIRTSGPNPLKHDIVKFCAVIVDNNLDLVTEKVLPFCVDIKPKRPENIEKETCKIPWSKMTEIQKSGLDPYLAADYFEEWFERLAIKHPKRLVPLVYNWSQMKPFMLNWLLYETCSQLIADQVRDLLVCAVSTNDRAHQSCIKPPFAKPIFTYLCSDTSLTRPHNSPEGDCLVLAKTYKRMMKLMSI